MIAAPKLSIRGDSARLTFVGPTSARVKAAIVAHIAKSGKPQLVSGLVKVDEFQFEQSLFYTLGKKNA